MTSHFLPSYKMRKKITLKDIAEDAGVSISTVSRALAQTGNISGEKERNIFESAQRLGYPFANESTPLELRKTVNIALVTYFFAGEFFSSLFNGFDKATENTNANICMLSVRYSSMRQIETIANLKKSGFDAAIVFLPDFTEKDYHKLLKEVPDSFPLVSTAPIVSPVLDTVTFDHYRGGYSVANHFREQGFNKLGLIKGPVSKSEALLRKNGFLDYIAEAGNLEITWECNGNYSLESGIEAYKKFAQSDTKPEAVFCSNDDVAIGFIHAAIRDGVRIPEDVAIAGFDDLPKCKYHTPTLTSVHTPYQILGKKVIEHNMNRLETPSKTQHTGYTSLVPVSLNVRESSLNSN